MQTKHLPAEERRQRTVEAVVALAGKQNPSEITTAAIASEMSVTQGALFRHFPSKEAIWQAVMEWVADRLLDRIDRAAEQSSSPLAALHAIFMSHIEFVIEHPGVPRMMFGELQRAEATPAKKVAHALMRRYAERLAHKLEEAKAGGEVLGDTDTKAAAILFIGMIQGLVMQSMLAGNLRAARAKAPGVIEIYSRGLGAGYVDRPSEAKLRQTNK
ncbi:TetR/AcrR family transcriptional regulator [Hyphomicrobium sp. DMF-1]|uniref:TetR/AcrR family transcriptional regulator n=1 Tax=Hyphomicrobium sp. DMF-1 TaxID=3019544 RepID=UPI0022EBDAAB|nr:TetR family transcriptional regulator [Hyphomicrobium sp. DMF-1]WBT37718.1 TetR family transcriptional regulator [Hyphomicrobium sp. DMF-1]